MDSRGRWFWREILRCAQDDNRAGILWAAGADVSGGYYRYALGGPPYEENWPEPMTPRPGSPDKAVALLKRSIEQGAVLVATGPSTNLIYRDPFAIITTETLDKLARALGVPSSELIEDVAEK